jgi:hypothetical protein
MKDDLNPKIVEPVISL